ncbi:MAG: 5-formyltetrahydrofolate cyclo-ligase [Ghiorsea sp.]|nr:5-formyltetrahydrofolate cyclo-ligase [Ghiorsea sp.]
MPDISLLKHRLRQQVANTRKQLKPEQRQTYSAQIMQYARNHLLSKGVQCLLIYKALPAEVNTDVLLVDDFFNVYVPRMLDDCGMAWVGIDAASQWEKAGFGVSEPVGNTLWQPSSVKTALLCPLLAFDHQGHRLGMGKGYFDRWLAKHGENIEVVGLAYSCQELSKVPIEPHDVPLATIITEHGVLSCPTV